MTTAVAERERPPEVEPDKLAVFRQQDAIVAKLKKHLDLKVVDLNDKKGLAAVHAARMEARDARIAVEKTRKKMNEEALAWQKTVNAEAKRVTAAIEPIESYLQGAEDAVEAEKDRIKREAEEVKRAKIKQRFDALQAVGYTGPMMDVPDLFDDEFTARLKDATEAKAHRDRLAEEEQQRQASEAAQLKKLAEEVAAQRAKEEAAATEKRRQEEAALKAERERLAGVQRTQEEQAAKVRAEQERVSAEQAKEAARLQAEQQRISDEAAARQRAIELEWAMQEAAERARKESEERHAREQAEAKATAERKAAQDKADAEAREQARLKSEREKPQREKLHGVAVSVLKLAENVPTGPGCNLVCEVLHEAVDRIREIANGPLN